VAGWGAPSFASWARITARYAAASIARVMWRYRAWVVADLVLVESGFVFAVWKLTSTPADPGHADQFGYQGCAGSGAAVEGSFTGGGGGSGLM
jgi:hypothetical protein